MSKKHETNEQEQTVFPEKQCEGKTGVDGEARQENNSETVAQAPATESSKEATQELQSKIAQLEQRIKSLESENSDLNDRYLRQLAELENFRKRMFREREEAVRFANSALLLDVTNIIDDFERALQSAEASKDFESFLGGVTLIERQLVEMLEKKWGLKRFSSEGDYFDPNKHEAVMRIEGSSEAKPVVAEDFQKGYLLHERVLRPAKVKVLMPSSVQGASETAPETEPNDGIDPTGDAKDGDP